MPSVTKLTREDATPLETKLEYLASCMIKEKNLISLGLNVDWSSTLFLAARMCLVDYKQINECFYWGEFRGWVYKRVDMEINCGDYHAGFKTYNTMVLTHLFREIIKQTPPLDLDVWTK